jgi:hypothetical protein
METTNQPGKEELKDFLNQYRRCKARERQLKERHFNLTLELKDPGLGSPYRTMPRSGSSSPESSVSVVFRIAEIETRISEQRDKNAKAMLRVMDVLEYLPADSIERSIMELRHIDCKGWTQIERAVFLSKSRCFDYYDKGLEKLTTYPRIMKLVVQYINDTDDETQD